MLGKSRLMPHPRTSSGLHSLYNPANAVQFHAVGFEGSRFSISIEPHSRPRKHQSTSRYYLASISEPDKTQFLLRRRLCYARGGSPCISGDDRIMKAAAKKIHIMRYIHRDPRSREARRRTIGISRCAHHIREASNP